MSRNQDAITQAMQDRAQLAAAYRRTFKDTAEGRRVYEDIVLRIANIYGPLFTGNEADTHYNAGRRDVGVAIYQLTEGTETLFPDGRPEVRTKQD